MDVRASNPAQAELDAYAAMERIRAAYPRFSGRQDWVTGEHHARRLVDNQLATWDDLLAGVTRYAAYCAGNGVSGPRYVLTPGKFFSAPDLPWSQRWEVPPSKAQARQTNNLNQSAAWLAQQESNDAPE